MKARWVDQDGAMIMRDQSGDQYVAYLKFVFTGDEARKAFPPQASVNEANRYPGFLYLVKESFLDLLKKGGLGEGEATLD